MEESHEQSSGPLVRASDEVPDILDRLASTPGKSGHVTLIAEALRQPAADVDLVLDVVEEVCAGSRIGSVTVCLVPERPPPSVVNMVERPPRSIWRRSWPSSGSGRLARRVMPWSTRAVRGWPGRMALAA